MSYVIFHVTPDGPRYAATVMDRDIAIIVVKFLTLGSGEKYDLMAADEFEAGWALG